MPKRPNPFGDIAPLQFKTHVGMKEIDMGSRQDELMKVVYEKTHERLFSGAQRCGDINDNRVQSLHVCTDLPFNSGSRFEPKQALLDSSGHLIPPLAVSSHKSEASCFGHGAGVLPSISHSEESDSKVEMAWDNQVCDNQAAVECRQFTSWFGSSSDAGGSRVPAGSVPSGSGQLCLTSSGQLRACHDTDMDCDADTSKGAGVGQAGHGLIGPTQTAAGLPAFGSMPAHSANNGPTQSLLAFGAGPAHHGNSGPSQRLLAFGSGPAHHRNSGPSQRLLAFGSGPPHHGNNGPSQSLLAFGAGPAHHGNSGPSQSLLAFGAGPPHHGNSGPSQSLLAFGSRPAQHNLKQGTNTQGLCCTCRVVAGGLRCQFCERAVCASCVRHCQACSEAFCQLCSTLNYDTDMERAFCLSCVPSVS